MVRWGALVVTVVAALGACGRFGFDATDGGAGGGGEAGSSCAYRLCEDFEAEALAPVWTPIAGATIDTTVAHGGTRSLHVHVDALPASNDAYAGIVETQTLPLNDPALYIRAWVRIAVEPRNNMELIVLEQSDPSNEDALFAVPGAMSVYSQFADRNTETDDPPAKNTWLCMLFSVTRATTAAGRLELAGDAGNVSLDDVRTDNATRPLRELIFGIGFSTTNVSQPAMDVWFDDLLVSAAPVTCTD